MGHHSASGGGEIPARHPHQQIHAVAAAAGVVFAAALVAKPAARPVVAVPAVAIGAAAGRAGLMTVLQLLRIQAGQLNQQPRPLAIGSRQGVACHQRSQIRPGIRM
jgi:hypothetical protein